MNRAISGLLLIFPLFGCDQTEVFSSNAINANREAFMEEIVRLEGVHVDRDDDEYAYFNGRRDYLTLEDHTGRIKVWYDTATRRCPPRLGAQITVTGKVMMSGPDSNPDFVANSISVDTEPALADNEVRMCQLSINEQQIYAEQGPAGLSEYWASAGKPGRELVFD